MNDFYTNVAVNGNHILYRGIENGMRVEKKEEFMPTLYVGSNNNGGWTTMHGSPVESIKPGSIRETKDFVKQYEGVQGFSLYGNTNFVQQFISDIYRSDIIHDVEKIKVVTIDIETETENGFPVVKLANEKVLLITVGDKITKKKTVFGVGPYKSTDPLVKYHECPNEDSLLRMFLGYWQLNYPDIVTGWNTEMFDIPYLVNRIKNQLGDKYAKKLSPWSSLFERTVTVGGRESIVYEIVGISSLDYLDLYKKFIPGKQESYKLDFICEQELGENKLENPGSSFKEFYTHYWDTFVTYNIRDVELVDKLEDKLRLIELVMTVAYRAKINFKDVFSPVKTWEAIIYNYLRDQRKVVPFYEAAKKTDVYGGAFVKDPIVGMHKWVASFDLNSLYPHLIMQYNISPDTITNMRVPCSVDDLLTQSIDTNMVKEHDYSMAANGWCFRRDKRGFLPELMQSMYGDRSKFKKQMLSAQQQYENDKTNKDLPKEISRLDNLQSALKILLNSAYGAMGSAYFTYYDLRMAEGITSSGQLSIRWVANALNRYMNKALKTSDVDYIIAIDTDSCYLSLEQLVEQTAGDKTVEQKIRYMDKICDDVIQPIINKAYQDLADYMNAYEQKMVMKREVLADKGVWIAKKRYILNVHNSEGVQYAKPKKKVMGLEMVRSTTPMVCRGKLRDSIDVIFEGSESALKQYVSDFKKEFMQLPIESIARPSGINGLVTYKGDDRIYAKGTPIHVRGSLLYNHHIKRLKLDKKYETIQDGDKIKFVYVRTPNPFQEDVIAFLDKLPDEFELDYFINRELQFQTVFVDALQIMVNPLKWNLDDSANLDDFFG